MNLAYNYVAIALMVMEINYIGPRLNLPMQFPVTTTNLTKTLVFPPSTPNSMDPNSINYGGRIDTGGYSFSFSDNGRLCYVTKMRPWGRMRIEERNDRLAKEKSLIDSKEALELGRDWLKGMDIQIASLEARSAPKVEHKFRWENQVENGEKEYLPIFEVRWGKDKAPDVIVEIDGRSKTILRLRLENEAVSSRPGRPIKNYDELLKLSDDTFLKLSEEERRTLILKHERFNYEEGKK